MIAFVLRVLINAVALFFIAGASGGLIQVKNWGAALLAALVLGVANAVVKPVLLWLAKSATCALSCLTLGLWSLVLSALVNGVLFYATTQVVGGFTVKNFWPASVVGALVLAVVNSIAGALLKGDDKERDER